MTRGLYHSISSYREDLDHCLAIASGQLKSDLRLFLFSDHVPDELARRQLSQTIVAQPILFSTGYALAKLLQRHGVEPMGMLGHSVGEYVSACLAGVFPLETALEIVCTRGRLVQSLPEGAMLAVSLPEKDIIPYLSDTVSLGSTIAERQCVVSGYPESIYQLAKTLKIKGVETKPVQATRAFHSMMLNPILDEFQNYVEGKSRSAPKQRFISGLDGAWINESHAQSADYWAQQLRRPVRFYEGLTTLLKEGPATFIEVGKGTMLNGLVRAHPLSTSALTCLNIIPASHQTTDEVKFFRETLSELNIDLQWKSKETTQNSESQQIEDLVQEDREPATQTTGTDLERRVATVFCEVLGIKSIEIEPNFLAAGGNSLMAMQILSRLRKQLGHSIPIRTLFDHPTVAGFSEQLRLISEDEIAVAHEAPLSIETAEATPSPSSKRKLSPPEKFSNARSTSDMRFSLFFFSGDAAANPEAPYQLVMDGAQFADEHDFDAIWIPERHFNTFGGLYPNPSVIGAAIAVKTKHIHIRGGSVVAPLHHPIRIAEEWSVLDNLSRGRIGVSFGSGFHPKDFLLAPEHFENRKEVMFETIRSIQDLWKGGVYTASSGLGENTSVSLVPTPYSERLPTWLTTSSSVETFIEAGQMGANVLTALLRLSLSELHVNIQAYRDALQSAGYPPEKGVVTLMLHTFVGSDLDTVRSIVERPMKGYLRSHMDHTKAVSLQKSGKETLGLSPEDEDALLDHAFNRYLAENSLIGTEESCAETLKKLREIGVNEIACLIDFGVSESLVIESLKNLNQVRELSRIG